MQLIPRIASAPVPAPASTPGADALPAKLPPAIQHPTAVKALLPLLLTPLAEPYLLTGAGDVIRAYDVSSPDEPELLAETDGHWHDVTALRLWMRRSKVEGEPGKVRVEPWVVSASLDGTIRRWRLNGECECRRDRTRYGGKRVTDVLQSCCNHRLRHRR